MLSKNAAATCAAAILLLSLGCSKGPSPGGSQPAAAPAGTGAAPAAPADEALPQVPSPYDVLPAPTRAILDRPFTGDFDEMVARRLIRAGVVFNRTQYFVDRGEQRGIAYESLKLFEEQVNLRLKTGKLGVHVAFVPLPRDQLLPALVDGKVDLVAATLTVTPEREKLVAFSNPTRVGVCEIAVTNANAPPVAAPDDLAGREVFVRRSSSYYESLATLNADLERRGRPKVIVREAPEALEDDDLLEMVNAGLVETIVVDDFVAGLWAQALPNLRLHPGAAVRRNGSLAVATRKTNPALVRAINIWIKEYGPRTTFGNLLERRYLQNTTYVKSAASEAERRKFNAVVELFRKHADRYQVDYLLMVAQGYQESSLDHSARSRVGAVGVMQVMPETGKMLGVGDVRQLEPNIHAGIKYIRFMMDEYFKDAPMTDLNKGLMTLASYNAGPARIRQLRQEAARRGLDPNVWFGHVERVASERIGRETVQYVSSIYKYYVAYRLIEERARERDRLKTAPLQRP